MAEAGIEVRSLRHRYGSRDVLSLDHWRVELGAHWAVVGPSGSGKTTLLHILAGLLRPTSGDLTVVGFRMSARSTRSVDHFRGRLIGFVSQKPLLIGNLRLRQNMALAQHLAGLSIDSTRINDVLWKLGLKEHAESYPHQLSRGQAQRAALARAVMNRPKVILADEPTASLDDELAIASLQLLMKQAHDCGATLVVTTHDFRVRSRFSNQLTLTAPQSTARRPKDAA